MLPGDIVAEIETQHQEFAAMQRELEPRIRGFIRRLIGVSSAEDDIVQNVFIALYRNLDKISSPDGLRPYVYGIIRNLCYDELRSRKRSTRIFLDESIEEKALTLVDKSASHESSLHLKMLVREVREAMDRLPEIQRQILILYSEEQLSYEEIAQVMNTSIGTVKSRLHYAKRAMRSLLKVRTLTAIKEVLD